MRVLHLTDVSFGGVVSLLSAFVAEQANRGHDVHVVGCAELPTMPGAIHHTWPLRRAKPATYLAGMSRLRALIAEIDPDVVHLHSFVPGFFGRLPGLPGRPGLPGLGGRPLVYQPHAWSFELRAERLFGRAVRSWESWAGRRTDLLVANCQDEIDEGRAAGVTTPARVIGVTVARDRFHPVDEEERHRWRTLIGASAPRVVVCVGRLGRQKGQDQLVAAWENDPPPDTELFLVGEGDATALMSRAPREWGTSIHATGDQADVRPWLWASDLLVLPSRYETVAVVVIEAMACARPVVATRVNGVSEALIAGDAAAAGTVVPLGDMRGLLLECRRRLDDAALRREEGDAGPARVAAGFTPALIGDRLDRAYADAIERRRQRI